MVAFAAASLGRRKIRRGRRVPRAQLDDDEGEHERPSEAAKVGAAAAPAVGRRRVSAYTRASVPAVTWPRLRSRSGDGRAPLHSRGAATAEGDGWRPTGTLMKKIHGQLKAEVSTAEDYPGCCAASWRPRRRCRARWLRPRPSAKIVTSSESAESEHRPTETLHRLKAISDSSDQARPQRSELDGEEVRPPRGTAALAEEVGESSAEQQRSAEHDRVRGDDPLQARLRNRDRP